MIVPITTDDGTVFLEPRLEFPWDGSIKATSDRVAIQRTFRDILTAPISWTQLQSKKPWRCHG